MKHIVEMECDENCEIEDLCEEGETQIDTLYESKPDSAYIDESVEDISGDLCNEGFIGVDTSNGQTHYIYMNWDSINVSEYEGAIYFDLLLYHKEDRSLIKVQLKNQTEWIDVCNPDESSSAVWDTCDLMPYLDILEEVSIIELRLVAWKAGTCHEYLGCAKLDAKLYKCEKEGPYCGDGNLDNGEECELPETNNNSFCCQTTEECLGNKLGVRDGLGYCDVNCGCIEDNFEYSCVKGECGAECESDGDCESNICNESYDDYCEDKKLVDYNANSILDSFEVEDDCENTCDLEGDCSCSDCEVDCSAEPLVHCVIDICGAECKFDIDCDDDDEHTLDKCNGCMCEYEQLPYCGDGNLDDGEECDDGNNIGGDGCSANCMIEYKCYEDSDCGEDGFIDDTFCVCTTNVWDWWVTYECIKPGEIDSYCVNTTEMKLREECGSDYCDDWEDICYNNDVYEGRICYDNGCKSGECFSNTYMQKDFVEDCGYSYCEYNWSYYCQGNDVYRERTCYDKGCDAGVCFEEDYIEDELFNECSDECIDGRCYYIECYCDDECPEDGYLGDEFCWCDKLFDYYVDYYCVNRGSVDSYCGSSTKLEIVGTCDGNYCTEV
jgi:hypothetical protein